MADFIAYGQCHFDMTLHPPNIATNVSRQFIKIAIRYRIFELLETGAKSLAELSVSADIAPRSLGPILNALVCLQLIATDGEGRYALTDRCDACLFVEIGARLRIAGLEQVRTMDTPGPSGPLLIASKPEVREGDDAV